MGKDNAVGSINGQDDLGAGWLMGKKTWDLGVTVSVKPMSSNNWRSWAKVILGLRILGPLSTKIFCRSYVERLSGASLGTEPFGPFRQRCLTLARRLPR